MDDLLERRARFERRSFPGFEPAHGPLASEGHTAGSAHGTAAAIESAVLMPHVRHVIAGRAAGARAEIDAQAWAELRAAAGR